MASFTIASPAGAASLGLDQRCYVAGEQAAVSGSGFAPRTPVSLMRGVDPLTAATADNSGAIRQTLMVPDVDFGAVESQVEVVASDGVTTARALMNVAKVGAAFTPATGAPRTLRVSHVISGFGLAEVKPSIYLHYISPTAQRAPVKPPSRSAPKSTTPNPSSSTATKSAVPSGGSTATLPPDPAGVKTVRLGQLRGPCGVLRTSPRQLFPFKTEAGTWLLQYDTLPRYTRGTASSPFLWVSHKVKIEP